MSSWDSVIMTQVENGKSLVETNIPEKVFRGFYKAKGLLTQTANTLKETTQKAKESLAETAGDAIDNITVTTDKAADTFTATAQQAKASVGETIEQTKNSLEQTLQTTGQLKNTTSEAIQTAINSSVSDWLSSHPIAFRLVQVLLWATNHPILSIVILLIAIAIAWSLIKAINRLIETAGLSLLKAPFMLGMVLIKASYRTLRKFGGLTVKQQGIAKTAELIHEDKKQRLAEISTRLEAIRQEQNELLQEAAAIFAETKST